jgi:uncharacterized membrane protein
MTKKRFQIFRLIAVILLGIAIGVSVSAKIAFIPPLAIVIAVVLIQRLYRRVKEVTADERDYHLAGRAALMTYRITTLTMVIIAGSLLAYSTANPSVYRAGYLLLYIACFMTVVNIFSFLVYQKKGDK